MPPRKETHLSHIFHSRIAMVEGDLEPPGGIDDEDGEDIAALELLCRHFDLDLDLPAQFSVEGIPAAPDLVAPLCLPGSNDGDIIVIHAHPLHLEVALLERIVLFAQKPTVLAPGIGEEGRELTVVHGASDEKDLVSQGFPVLDVGRDLEIVLRLTVGGLFLLGEISHVDIVLEMVAQLELAVFFPEEGFEHLVVNRVAQFFIPGLRLETAADHAVDPGDRFLFIGDENSPQARLHRIRFAFVHEYPRRPLAQGAENLVADGLGLRRDLIGRDVSAILPSHEDHLVADLTLGDVADIEGAHVHGDPAHDGSPFPADQGLTLIGENHAVTVAVPHGNGGDARGTSRDISPSVTDPVAFREILQEHDARLEAHHGIEQRLGYRVLSRIDAVGHDPRPHHVEVELREIEDAAAVGHVTDGNPDPLLLKLPQKVLKKLPLHPVIRIVFNLARGKVRENPLHADGVHPQDVPDHGKGLPLNGSAAAHPRINLDVDGQFYSRFFQPPFQFPGKPEIRYGGGEVVLDDLVDLRIRGGTQDHDRGVDSPDPELNAFIGIGHTQEAGAVFQGHVGDLNGAVTVRVGLHHLKNLHPRAHEPLDLRPVSAKIVQVHLDPASVFLLFFYHLTFSTGIS